VEDDQHPGESPEQTELPGQADLPEQVRVRLGKRERLLAEGIDPYPVDFPRTDTIAEVRARHPDLAPDTATGEKVSVTGRVMLSRPSGKLSFATIRDGTGEIQVMLSADRIGEDALTVSCRCWPTGSLSRPRPSGRFPTNTMG
jgi:lysyl-tRNA synthetase, class II